MRIRLWIGEALFGDGTPAAISHLNAEFLVRTCDYCPHAPHPCGEVCESCNCKAGASFMERVGSLVGKLLFGAH